MKYMIVYSKTTPAISYRSTIDAAQALAQQLKRRGYTVEIWEQGAEEVQRWHKGTKNMAEIRSKYGSATFARSTNSDALPA